MIFSLLKNNEREVNGNLCSKTWKINTEKTKFKEK